MRKILIWVIIVLAAGLGIYFGFRRTPYSIARHFTGFKIPSSCNVIETQDQWSNNPGGDGETFILFSFESNVKDDLIAECKNHGFVQLPITRELPDDFIYRYINKNSDVGYYKIDIDKNDSRTYSIAILDLQKQHLIVYNVIY